MNRSVLHLEMHKTILSCIFAPKSLLLLDEQRRYYVIWMWKSNFLVAGKHLRFLLSYMIQPCTTLSSAQERGKNGAKLFSFFFFLLSNLQLTTQGQNEKIWAKAFWRSRRESRRFAANCNWFLARLQIQPKSGGFHSAAVVPGPPVSPWGILQASATDNANLTCASKSNSLFN